MCTRAGLRLQSPRPLLEPASGLGSGDSARELKPSRDSVGEPVITRRLRKVLLLLNPPTAPRLRLAPDSVVGSCVPRQAVKALASGGAPAIR